MTYPPEATTKANISGILDQNDKDVTSANGKTVNLNFFDARGYSYTAKFTFKQSGGDKTNEYSLELNKDSGFYRKGNRYFGYYFRRAESGTDLKL